MRVRLSWDGMEHELTAPLFGAHHAVNLAVAFASACVMGVRPEDAKLALKTAPQIAHRLEVKPQADGSIKPEAMMDVNHVAQAVAQMAHLQLVQQQLQLQL